MANGQYNIPSDKQAKAKLLEELLTGKKTIEDLMEDTMDIRLNLNPTDADREQFNSNRERQESFKGDGNICYLTIDLKQ